MPRRSTRISKPPVRYEDEFSSQSTKPRSSKYRKVDKKAKGKWVWQFKENDGKFHNYDQSANELIEEAYAKFLNGGIDVYSVKSGGRGHYMVDFRELTQTNITHENHTIRSIRRIQK